MKVVVKMEFSDKIVKDRLKTYLYGLSSKIDLILWKGKRYCFGNYGIVVVGRSVVIRWAYRVIIYRCGDPMFKNKASRFIGLRVEEEMTLV